METLKYRGRALGSRTVQGQSPQQVGEWLKLYRYAYVQLEPGDATHYELHLFRHPRQPDMIGVVYVRGEAPYATVWYAEGDSFALRSLTRSDWSVKFLGWWLDQVVASLVEEDARAR